MSIIIKRCSFFQEKCTRYNCILAYKLASYFSRYEITAIFKALSYINEAQATPLAVVILHIWCKYYDGYWERSTCLLFWSVSLYTVIERVKSRFAKITQNVTKIRYKCCKLHQITNRPATSPRYRCADFHFQNV